MFTRFTKKEEPIEAVPNPTVVVQTPETGNIELSTGLTGTVEPADQVYIIPKGSGEVLEVYVNQGDTVQKGQKLFRIDNKQLDAARITLNTTQDEGALRERGYFRSGLRAGGKRSVHGEAPV